MESSLPTGSRSCTRTAQPQEVYIQAFPQGPRVQVDTADAPSPRWSARGDEIFYRSNGKVMSVQVRNPATLEIGVPRALFDLPLGATSFWQVDGDRFLIQVRRSDAVTARPPYSVLVNWTPGSSTTRTTR
jgi:hypothetical protein